VGLTRARDRLIIGGRLRSDRKIENVKAWWGPLSAAFAALGDQVREVQTASGPARRYGADPQPRPRAVAAHDFSVEAPAWLTTAPPREAKDRWSSPSGVDAGSPLAPSPLQAEAGLGRFRRGELIHRLFEVLPEIVPAERAAAAERLLAREPGLTAEQRGEMISAAVAVLDDPRFAEVFGPSSRAEVAVAGRAPELAGPVSGRVDRLVVTPERVLVVDFKTNRPAPDAIDDADPAYLRQMAVYVAVLRAVFPGRRVEAALLWTDGPRLMAVPEPVIERVLAGLASG
jgi:ATP-dependent helicase/nuclease subunit A